MKTLWSFWWEGGENTNKGIESCCSIIAKPLMVDQ
jgi:hypothetical protein